MPLLTGSGGNNRTIPRHLSTATNQPNHQANQTGPHTSQTFVACPIRGQGADGPRPCTPYWWRTVAHPLSLAGGRHTLNRALTRAYAPLIK